MISTSDDEIYCFGMRNSRDLYEKLKVDAERLKKAPCNNYECFNFIITAFHLYKYWLKNDESKSNLTTKKYENISKDMRNLFKALENVSNGSKHMKLRDNYKRDHLVVTKLEYESINNWHAYFFAPFPNIVTEHTEYKIYSVKDIVMDYFEWIFDDNDTNTKFPAKITEQLKSCLT